MNYEGFQIIYQIIMLLLIHVMPQDVNVVQNVTFSLITGHILKRIEEVKVIFICQKEIKQERGRPDLNSC